MKAEITPGQAYDYLGVDLAVADNLPKHSAVGRQRL